MWRRGRGHIPLYKTNYEMCPSLNGSFWSINEEDHLPRRRASSSYFAHKRPSASFCYFNLYILTPTIDNIPSNRAGAQTACVQTILGLPWFPVLTRLFRPRLDQSCLHPVNTMYTVRKKYIYIYIYHATNHCHRW